MGSPDRHPIDSFRTHSFFILPGFAGDEARAKLRWACDAALEVKRASSRETGHSTPSVTLLGEGEPAGDARAGLGRVAAFVTSPRICSLLFHLGPRGEEDSLRLKDMHYYHEQTRHDWDGDWHRDSQFGRPDAEEERTFMLTTTSLHVRIALEDDDRLEIVPGSHARWDTPDELRIRKGPDRARADMPNSARIALRAGDACVFHAWSIHRATYRRAPVRRTIDALYVFRSPAQRQWVGLSFLHWSTAAFELLMASSVAP
jgi:hypothetical protein